MDANRKTTMKWTPMLWFGIVALLPSLAGCGSILPLSRTERAELPLIATNRGSGERDQQIVPASFDSSENTAAARFDLALFRQENQLPEPVEEKKKLPAESRPVAEKMTFDQAVTATLMADPKIRAVWK